MWVWARNVGEYQGWLWFECMGIRFGALTCSGSRAGGLGLWLVSAGGSSIVVVLAAPEMSACRCWIAVSSSSSVFCLPSIASFN